MRITPDMARAIFLFCLGFAVVAGALKIGVFTHLTLGLDPSWVAALGEATRRGDTFGKEIIFTGGPLSSLYTRYFDPANWAMTFGAGILVAASAGVSLAYSSAGFVAVAMFVFAFMVTRTDAALVAIPVLAVLAYARSALSPIPLILGGLASAALLLAKFSVFPVAALAFPAADFLALKQRRVPMGTLIFLGSWFLLYSVLAPGEINFRDYFFYSLETSLGYSDAMSLSGSRTELALFGLCLTCFGIAAALDQVWGGEQRSAPIAVILMALAVMLWITFKLGFVRHDLHSLTAWSGVSLAAAMYLCFVSRGLAWSRIVLCGICLSSGATVIYVWQEATKLPWHALFRSNSEHAASSARSLIDLVHQPSLWLETRLKERAAAWDAAKAEAPLPSLQGSVDAIPSIQAAVIANGLEYRPRFTIQEYTTYTPALARKNRDFIRGPRAPEYFLFAPGSIDERHPASAEGSLWPDLISAYAPTRMSGRTLIMQRESKETPDLLGPAKEGAGRIGQPFSLPLEPAFMKVQIRPSIIGKVLGLLWRRPQLRLRLTYSTGLQEGFRLVPGQAAAGFIVSPRIGNSEDVLAFIVGSPGLPSVREAVIETSGWWTALAYDPSFEFSTQSIRRPDRTAPENAFLELQRRRFSQLRRILDRTTLQPPGLSLISEGLFAHAPSQLPITVHQSTVVIGFGLQNTQYPPIADGVCFSVKDHVGRGLLWQRCLHPSHAADREPQRAIVQIPVGVFEVVLETECRENCGADFAYWSEVTFP